MSMAVHCDRDGCDTWQRTESDLPVDWFNVTTNRLHHRWGADNTAQWSFCTLDCLMHWAAARSTPTETYGA